MGEGVSARFSVGEYDSTEYCEQSKIRMEGARKALENLGTTDVTFGTHLCCQFDTVPMIVLSKKIEEVMARVMPTILLTHNPSEVNIDHQLTYRAVEIACRPTQAYVPKAIYAFEIVCSGNWTFDTSFKPNVFVDIEEFWGKKMEAWHYYQGEARPFPFPRSDKGLETLARFRGLASGLNKAEAFRLVRQIV
jgi:LmbE family N-acetylglucosaminyl deacetylase